MTCRWGARRTALGLSLVAPLCLSACVGERIVTAAPHQAGVFVSVSLEPKLASAAANLGWPSGAVPGALVIARRADARENAPADTAIADSSGLARFAALPADSYTIRVTRDLTTHEQQRAGGALGGVYALEGSAAAAVSAQDGSQVTIQARGVDRGSLLISEIFPNDLLTSGGYYSFGKYIEIYDNADTAISLAGKIVVAPFAIEQDSPKFPCSNYAQFLADPAGLWAEMIWRFPADAGVLKPGQSAVIATDAIDHTQFGSGAGFFDLSRAAYEFRGAQDTDNPLSTDVEFVGTRDDPFGHGWEAGHTRNVLALAAPLDIDTLPRKIEHSTIDFTDVRIPTAAILDVVQWQVIHEIEYPLCPSAVISDLNSGEARLLAGGDTLAMHRRVRYSAADDHPVLQRSRNSAADFLAAPGTPGRVP